MHRAPVLRERLNLVRGIPVSTWVTGPPPWAKKATGMRMDMQELLRPECSDPRVGLNERAVELGRANLAGFDQ